MAIVEPASGARCAHRALFQRISLDMLALRRT
jgi:hypothetical protein